MANNPDEKSILEFAGEPLRELVRATIEFIESAPQEDMRERAQPTGTGITVPMDELKAVLHLALAFSRDELASVSIPHMKYARDTITAIQVLRASALQCWGLLVVREFDGIADKYPAFANLQFDKDKHEFYFVRDCPAKIRLWHAYSQEDGKLYMRKK